LTEQDEGPGRNSVWDSHAHLLPEGRSRSLVRWIKKSFPGHPVREDITHDEIIADLRACGVEVIFNFVFPLRDDETEPLNSFSAEVGRRYGFVVPFGSLHANTPRKDEVAERCVVEMGLAGMKLHPYVQGFEAFSPGFEPLFRALARLEKPLVVHTGFDFFYSRTQDLDYLQRVLERHPDMPLVLVHSLFPRFGLAHELMGRHERLYLDMTNVLSAVRWYTNAPGGAWPREEAALLEENMDRFHAVLKDYSGRVMFGTDHPAGMGSPSQIYADLDSFDFPPEVRGNLLCGAARAFHDRW